VQFITLDPAGRERAALARAWIEKLTAAIRAEDPRHLVTVGLVHWSLDIPGVMSSGFAPEKIADTLDFICVHLYPGKEKEKDPIETLTAFAKPGKPVVVEETFPLWSSLEDFDRFIDASRPLVAGWIGFYWGKSPEELRESQSIHDMIMLRWLEYFERKRPDLGS
jgi:hypothetical protein